MLNWNQVLNYIKANLSLPSGFIEDNDSEITDYLCETALQEFSTYMPDLERTAVVTTDDRFRVPGSNQRFYFFDEEDCDIISLVECYFDLGDSALISHPLVGALTFNSMSSWATQVFKAKTFAKFSSFNRTYKFIIPNIVEIHDTFGGFRTTFSERFLVEYERVQPKDLSRIPTAMNMTFKDLCLARYMLKLGNIRSAYGDGQIETPYGTIPLQGSELRTRGEELLQKMTERLAEETVPPIYIAIN